MLVFKSFFKIIKYDAWSLMIYVFLYIGLMVVGGSGTGEEIIDFETAKTNIVIINEDKESTLIEGFGAYLSQYTREVYIEDDEQALQDALIFRRADYILRIPQGFTEAFLQGHIKPMEKTLVEESAYASFVDRLIERYWETADQYRVLMPELNEEVLVAYVNELLVEEAEVYLTQVMATKTIGVKLSMNYMSYVLMTLMILVIGMSLESFYREPLYKRNCCGPRSKTVLYIQLLSANVIFAIGCLASLLIMVSIKHDYGFFSKEGMLFMLNSFVFLLVAASMGFVIGLLTKKLHVQNMIANTVALGLSFISGVFVAKDYLPEEVLNVARFLPTYWYVEANELISELMTFSVEQIGPIVKAMSIQGGFAIAIICIGIVINKQKYQMGSE